MRQTVLAAVFTATLVGGWEGSRERAWAAAPAPTSYASVEHVIAEIRGGWSQPGAAPQPNAGGWNELFDSLLGDLRAYSHAADAQARLAPLNRIFQVSQALAAVPWAPAEQLREELRQWLRPRVRLAWAVQRLDQTVLGLPPAADPAVQANRQRWVQFVSADLGQALAQYNGASTVKQRQEGLNAVHQALQSLRTRNQEYSWQPSLDLQTAVNDLFNQPNLDVTADVHVVSPLFDQNLVTSGPVYRKGYWSQVTAGPKTGFGLLPSDDGISFYNSQLLTSVTPVTDFQNQIAQDAQGQRAAKMYYFTATTINQAQLTMYATLSTSGLALAPAYNHNIDANICSTPMQGGGFGRMIASLIGMNQNAITQRVYEGAIGQFRQRIPQEAMEEATERIQGELAQRNGQMANYLIGNNMLAVQDFLVTGLSLRSRPEAVYASGLLQSRTGERSRGADAPQPARLAVPDPGLTADVHLSSVLTEVADILYRRLEVQETSNLMIQTRDVPPGTPPRDAVAITRNADFPTFLKAVNAARKANNPKVTAVRLKRPPSPPEFAVDARGFLVATFRGIEVDVPAPDAKSQGGRMISVPAQVLKLKLPHLEIALSQQVQTAADGSLQVQAKVEEFAPAADSQVLAINDDEARGSPLNRFSSALMVSMMGARLRTMPLAGRLDNLYLRGLAVRSVSPLDPSGWIRVSLARTSEPISLEIPQTSPAPAESAASAAAGTAAPEPAQAVSVAPAVAPR